MSLLAIVASSERTRVYVYASSSCLEKKGICMCIGKWCLVNPLHRLPGVELLKQSSPNIWRRRATIILSQIVN